MTLHWLDYLILFMLLTEGFLRLLPSLFLLFTIQADTLVTDCSMVTLDVRNLVILALKDLKHVSTSSCILLLEFWKLF